MPHQAVHAPYQPPGRPDPAVTKENMSDGDRRAYAAMLAKVDEGVGMLLAEEPERTFFWRIDHAVRKQKAVRHGRWKYVQDGGYVHLLFDLEEDVSERRNLAIHHPEVMRDLRRRLAAWEAEVDAGEKEIRIR